MKRNSMITMLVIALMLVLSLTVLSACGENEDDNKDDPPAKYSVTVTNGTGGGEYAEGAAVKIKANAPETGKEFTSWTIEGVTVDDKTNAEITFTMPANAVTATANYGDVQYEFALENCTADKETAKFGEQVTFTADEVIGKRFDSWNIKGVDDLTGLDLTKSPLTITMPANDINVAAVLEDIDYTVTVTDGTTDKETAHYGDTVTITANAPETGKRFTGWTITGVDTSELVLTNKELTFTMPTGNVTATANYVIEDYEIKVTGGTAQVNDGNTFHTLVAHYGDNVKIKAFTPEKGKRFTGWTIEGVTVENTSVTELTFTMPAGNVTATANYEFIDYTVTVNGGTANKTTAHYDEEVTITAEVPVGKDFVMWSFDGLVPDGLTLTDKELTFTMPANDVTATAKYVYNNYNVTVNGGTANKTTAHYGEEVTITAEVPTGKRFVMWSFEGLAPDGLEITNPQLTFTMPAKAVTVTAVFEYINYTVTVNGGTADKTTAHYGDTVTITANEPGTNKEFIGWNSPNGVVFNDNTSIETTFIMPASNVTVNAVFRDINKYSVLVNYDAGAAASDSQTAYCGDPVTITAKDIEGRIFVRWEITGLDTEGLDLTKSTLTFTMPEKHVTANAIYEDLITLTFEGNIAQSERLTYRKGASKTFRIELGDSQELCEYDISLTNKSCTFKVYDSLGNEIEPTDNGDGSMRIAVNRQDTYTIRVTYEGTSSTTQCAIKITASSPTV